MGKETNIKANLVNKQNLAKLNAILFCSDQFMKYGIVPFAGKGEFMETKSDGKLAAVADGFKEGIKSMVVPEEELIRGTGAAKERASTGHRSVEDMKAPSIEKGWEEEGQEEGLQSSEEPARELSGESSVEELRPQAIQSVGELHGEQGPTESLQQEGSEEGQHKEDGHSKYEEQSGKGIEEEGWFEKEQSEEGARIREEGAGNFKEEPTEATQLGAKYGVSSVKERGTEPGFYEEGQHMPGEEGR